MKEVWGVTSKAKESRQQQSSTEQFRTTELVDNNLSPLSKRELKEYEKLYDVSLRD